MFESRDGENGDWDTSEEQARKPQKDEEGTRVPNSNAATLDSAVSSAVNLSRVSNPDNTKRGEGRGEERLAKGTDSTRPRSRQPLFTNKSLVKQDKIKRMRPPDYPLRIAWLELDISHREFYH
ncbi:hypothetical protein RRG08_046340 [Elysia crispata]|uniref:Uncharacterized protein n=1 Tax=Elysia crispata TaxID=231223 RepID=A0AAE1DS54_9GAST|nr:hypothetical protein RRG08_046340 [Elysia crispata]